MAPKDLIKSERNVPNLPDGQLVWIPPGFMLTTEEPKQAPEAHLWDYIWMIWRKRWLILLVFLVSVSVAALVNFKAVPIYQATAKLRIENEASSMVLFQDQSQGMSVASNSGPDFISTQLQVITGYKLAQQVMDKLDPFGAPKNQTPPLASAAKQTTQSQARESSNTAIGKLSSSFDKIREAVGLSDSSLSKSDQDSLLTEQEKQALVNQMRIKAFLNGLSVKPIAGTQLISVSYMSADPQRCFKVVNTVCDEYIKWTYESKYDSFSYARNWLKEKLDEMKGKLEQSENDLIKLTGGQDFVVMAEDQIPQRMESYRQRIADAQRVLFEKQFELDRYKSGKNFSVLRILNDPRLNTLLDSYSQNQILYDTRTAELGPKSREVRTIAAEMAGIEKQLQEAYNQAKVRVQSEYDQAKANLDYLQKGFEEEKTRATGIQKNMIQYNILKREVDINRELYNSLLQRWKEVGLNSGVKAGFASVIEPALPPMAPTLPNKLRTLMIGAMMGLFLGVGMVFFLDYMDTSVKEPEELERITKLSILGYVGHCEFRRTKGERQMCVELMSYFRPRSEFAECVRSIRTSIQYSRAGSAPNTILVTSCLPGEGKTTIATNLAIALASRGKKVLLVDADLKKPSLNKLFNVDRKLGLTEVLTGKFDGTNLPETEIENLFVMPSGSKPPNPVELLDSDVMRRFLERAANEYDHVVLDSAPSLNMADTSVMAPYVDGLILVVQPGKTPREAVRRVRERLMEVQGSILGLVVNNPVKSAQARYSHRYGYGYGYGGRYGYGQDQAYGRVSRGGHQEYGAGSGNGYGRQAQEVLDITVAALPDDSQDRDQ